MQTDKKRYTGRSDRGWLDEDGKGDQREISEGVDQDELAFFSVRRGASVVEVRL